jgi:hypothetical protein
MRIFHIAFSLRPAAMVYHVVHRQSSDGTSKTAKNVINAHCNHAGMIPNALRVLGPRTKKMTTSQMTTLERIMKHRSAAVLVFLIEQ